MKKILIVVFFVFLFPMFAFALEDCPYDLVNDKYPGQCGRYVDTNNDQICDHSQENPVLIAQNSEINVSENTNTQKENEREGYNFVGITTILFVLYLFTFLLVKYKKMSIVLHRRIWNMFLLVTFFVTAFSGIALVVRINYGISFGLSDLLESHVEFGIAMAVVSIFHILWHIPYFKSIFKFKK